MPCFIIKHLKKKRKKKPKRKKNQDIIFNQKITKKNICQQLTQTKNKTIINNYRNVNAKPNQR